MDSTLKAQYTAETMVLKALAHPARLLIVHELAANETQTMSGLAGLIGIEISSVCRHLTKLKEVGIVVDKRDGARVTYRLGQRCVEQLLESVGTVMRCNARAQQALATRSK